MREGTQLERAAIEAHEAGQRWPDFLREHHDAIREVEPWDRRRYHCLLAKLMHLVCTGDPNGQEPPPMELPWDRDDAARQPDDVETKARLRPDLFPEGASR